MTAQDGQDGTTGERYAARIAAIAATGVDMHGEASFCAGLVLPGARVLDAGCGTGRVGARLAELGLDCLGVDVDEAMLAAAPAAPGVRWLRADLTTLDLPAAGIGAPFDLVVAAGNVIPLVPLGTQAAVVGRLAAHLAPGGLLVAGFGLDRPHLPPAAAVLDIDGYDGWCAAAGLVKVARHAGWDRADWPGPGGYAVSVHRRGGAGPE